MNTTLSYQTRSVAYLVIIIHIVLTNNKDTGLVWAGATHTGSIMTGGDHTGSILASSDHTGSIPASSDHTGSYQTRSVA